MIAPAFPHQTITLDPETAAPVATEHGGLTKRELFAAMALNGLLSNEGRTSPGATAGMAVAHADALIAELSKNP